MKYAKRLATLFLALSLALGMSSAQVYVQAAGKKAALSKTKATMAEGETMQLELKNAPKGKAVKWSSNKKSVATVTQKGKVTAKKAGKAKITATVNKEKYSCAITVKKFELTNTEGKNAADVKVLKSIIQKQNAQGANMPTDLEKEEGEQTFYKWDEKGNLTEIDWRWLSLKGKISLKGLDSLTCARLNGTGITGLDVSKNTALVDLYCYENKLTSLDVSKNKALARLFCSENQLTSLDVSKNTALAGLYCSENQIASLDVSKNTALVDLFCYENQIASLDLGKNTALEELACSENQIASLDLGKNKALTYLSCSGNQLTSLDLAANTALTYLCCFDNQIASLDLAANTALDTLICDDSVAVTGYEGKRLNTDE